MKRSLLLTVSLGFIIGLIVGVLITSFMAKRTFKADPNLSQKERFIAWCIDAGGPEGSGSLDPNLREACEQLWNNATNDPYQNVEPGGWDDMLEYVAACVARGNPPEYCIELWRNTGSPAPSPNSS